MYDVERAVRRQSFAFLVISIIASGLLLIVGFQLGTSTVWGSVLTALGGGALGACLGIVLSTILDAAPFGKIQALLSNTLDSEIFADEKELAPYRRVWHHYIFTRTNDGEMWRYRKIDLSQINVRGKLLGAIDVPRPSGGTIRYQIEGFLIGTRLTFVQTPLGGAEPHIIHLFPVAGEQFREVHSGIAVLKNWEGNNMMVPVLMSEKPLVSARVGTLSDDHFKEINARWQTDFSTNQALASTFADTFVPPSPDVS